MTREQLKELDYLTLEGYKTLPEEHLEMIKPIIATIDFDKIESDKSAILIYPLIYKLVKNIITQPDWFTHFGDFNTPEIINKALTYIDPINLASIIDQTLKNLVEDFHKFANIDAEGEIVNVLGDNLCIEYLRKAKNNI